MAPQAQSEHAEAEYAEAGPTWSSAKDACARLDSKSGVGCALVVIVESGTPVLDLGYPTRDDALRDSKRDIAEAWPAFCDSAEKHGLLELATVRISTPGHTARRSCRELRN